VGGGQDPPQRSPGDVARGADAEQRNGLDEVVGSFGVWFAAFERGQGQLDMPGEHMAGRRGVRVLLYGRPLQGVDDRRGAYALQRAAAWLSGFQQERRRPVPGGGCGGPGGA
jgi:hypothetical protein